MYRTIKIRIRLSIYQKDYLLKYETIYHNEINKIYNLFSISKRPLPIKKINITDNIKEQSHWALYQIALYKYKRNLEGKQYTYQKSSTWSPLNAVVLNSVLIISYGDLFPISRDALMMCINDKQLATIGTNRIVRIDLVHDEMFWYVNYLIKIEEASCVF